LLQITALHRIVTRTAHRFGFVLVPLLEKLFFVRLTKKGLQASFNKK
jgi:hypothetical protein